MATTQLTKAAAQALYDQRCLWLDANSGVTINPIAQPVVVTSRLVTTFPLTGAAGSGSRTASAVQITETDFAIARQVPPADPVSWSGCFLPNDGILVTDPSVERNGRELTVTLSGDVYVIGLQVQPQEFDAYTGTVVFRNAATATLLTLALAGNSTSAGDNSATFYGAQDDAGALRSIVVTCTDDLIGFGINSVDIRVGALATFGAGGLPAECGHPLATARCLATDVFTVPTYILRSKVASPTYAAGGLPATCGHPIMCTPCTSEAA